MRLLFVTDVNSVRLAEQYPGNLTAILVCRIFGSPVSTADRRLTIFNVA